MIYIIQDALNKSKPMIIKMEEFCQYYGKIKNKLFIFIRLYC